MRIALLGCGGIAPRHVTAVKALGHDFVACVGRDSARTAAFAAQHGGAPFTDLDRMIDAEAPELLIATLPPFARQGEIEHAAARGVHLLVEKPIALDVETAERMTNAVEATGIVAAIGFMYRFGDAINAWRIADTGPAGLYAGSYHCNALHADWWRDERKSGGQIVEQVIHQIDLIRHLIGEPAAVYARRANMFHREVPDYSVEDVSAIIFGFADGRIATINASNIATPGVWAKTWTIYAKHMTGRFADWNAATFTPAVEAGTPIEIAGTTDVFTAQLADVAAAIRERRLPAVPLSEGVATLKLALAARQSADEGHEIGV